MGKSSSRPESQKRNASGLRSNVSGKDVDKNKKMDKKAGAPLSPKNEESRPKSAEKRLVPVLKKKKIIKKVKK